MTEPRPHDQHDALRIAAYAAGDLEGRDRDEASRLVAECRECAALDADLRSIALATRELPAPARRRDFSLSPADAERLRRRSWRRWLRALAGPRFAVVQPLGVALTSLGVAGLLLVSLQGVSFGGAATLEAVGDSVPAAQAPAAASPEIYPMTNQSPGDGRLEQAPEDANDTQGQSGGGSGSAQGTELEAEAAREDAIQRSTDSTLAILSGSLLIAGLGLFGLRWTARRFGD